MMLAVIMFGISALGGSVLIFGSEKNQLQRPSDIVSIHDFDPTIQLDIRYHGIHNFLGRPVNGYLAPKCLLTKLAAEALAKVQVELLPFSLSLKVYDCYRPQRAVNDFVAWAKELGDIKMKKEFYPKVDKANLFNDGYIASKSGHSRGSTVDITLVTVPTPAQPKFQPGQHLVECFLPAKQRYHDNSLDMGTGYDCFDPLAHTNHPAVRLEQRRNRLLLKSLMEKHGFKNYAQEWWHFTLINEPYLDQFFDFEVE